MHRFANLVEEHAEELALLECRNVGMPIGDARGQLSMIVDVIRYYAGAVDKFFGHTIPVERDGVALTFREPIGVVGADHAVELPAQHRQLEGRAGARGRQHRRAQAGQPDAALGAALRRAGGRGRHAAGTLNVVPGPGRTVGNALVEHPAVGKIGFTGSTAVGAEIARRAAAHDQARDARAGRQVGVRSCSPTPTSRRSGAWRRTRVFENCGQDCCARSRLIVQESVKDEVLERYAATAAGHPRRHARGPRDAGRPADLGRPARDGRGLHPNRRRRGRADRHRRRPPGRRARRTASSCSPTVLDGVDQRHDGRPRGDLRPRRQRHHLPRRGRGRAHRERHALRPVRLAVDARRRAPAAGRARAAHGRARRQHELLVFVADAVRRLQAVRRRQGARACTRSSTTPS